MTIFVRVAKELIIRVLNKSNDDSIKADAGYGSHGRDLDNALKQRNATTELMRTIDSYIPTTEHDKESLDKLKKFIAETDSDIEAKRAGKGWERGGLNKTLSKLNEDLDRLYRVIEDGKFICNNKQTIICQLLNMENNKDPYHVLCAYAIYYLGEHILCPPEQGVFVKIAKSFLSLLMDASKTDIAIRKQKEYCLIKNLMTCKLKLDTLDTDNENYTAMRRQHTLETIEAIGRENKAICEETSPIDTIPIQFSFFAVARINNPGMKPSRGRLRFAMDHAAEEINDVITSPSVSNAL